MNDIYYNKSIQEIREIFQTNKNAGLTEIEAKKRLELYGLNEIPKVKKSIFKVYLAPLFNWLIVIYLIGALILFLAVVFLEEGNLTIVYLTLGIVGMNCVVAIVQQYRATKKLEALRQLSAPTTVVMRDSEKKQIPTNNVVPGDLLVLNQGDRIPADARIIESSNLLVNESSLTGESEPVKKLEKGTTLSEEKIPISERKNMIFYGTFIATGNGKAITVRTGGNTEIGKISHLMEEAGTSEIPIREKMNNFGKWLGLAVLIFWFGTLMIKWIMSQFTTFEIVDSLNSAMDIMPINIPLLTTIVLLTGVLFMAQKGVVIRNLASVDSLGRVSVVCSDKTGTLTQNQMCVQYVWVNGSIFKISGSGYNPEGDIILMDDIKNPKIIKNVEKYPQLKLLLISGFLNNNSALVKKEVKTATKGQKFINKYDIIGSPTEGALNVLYQKSIQDYSVDEEFKFIREYPFDSSIKRMTKIYKKEKEFYSFTKGATEVLIPQCKRVLYHNKEVDLSEDLKQEILNNVNKYANMGYRILSLCYKKLDILPENLEESRENCEKDMIYIGFVTILDPPREGVKESVELCNNAGVEVIMITGDSLNTAKAIASQIAILSEGEVVIQGSQIKSIESFEELNKVRVFARVSPEHKQDIVEKYQDQKKVVAMTGDGVNDALALNMADAGIAMGIQGTDVAKEASDMVISDDSFISIVEGIREGRGIFTRIRTVVFFYICINLFEGIFQFILFAILGLPYFLTAEYYLQWIFLSITLHTFPGLVLTFDTTSKDIMKEKPRDSEEILSKNIIVLLLIFGGLLAISMGIVYSICVTGIYPVFPLNYEFNILNAGYLFTTETMFLTPSIDLNVVKTLTMLMTTLFFSETILVLQIRRPNKSLIKSIKEESNKRMYLILGFLFAVFLLLMYFPGFQVGLAHIGINFMFMYLTALDWLICFLISSITIVGFELVKYYARKKEIYL